MIGNVNVSNLSKMSEQVLEVLAYAYDDIKLALELGDCSEDQVRYAIRKAFFNVAEERGRKESTIRDKCTRQLNIDTETFIELALSAIARKNDKLLERLIEQKKDSLEDKDNIRYAYEQVILW